MTRSMEVFYHGGALTVICTVRVRRGCMVAGYINASWRGAGRLQPLPNGPGAERDTEVVLVALDSNVVDLVELACGSPEHLDAMEAMEPPPRFVPLAPQQEVEVFACYWLLALAPAWRSTVYTFSDLLYDELAGAPCSGSLLRVALDVLVREWQEPECRMPDPARRPASTHLISLGLRPADANHVADAIGLGCHRFLTNDKQLRNKSTRVAERWGIEFRRPSEFLTESIKAGAPWTTRAPWPWESIEPIRRGGPIVER